MTDLNPPFFFEKINPLLIYKNYLYQIFHPGRQKLICLNNSMDKKHKMTYKLISEPKIIPFFFSKTKKCSFISLEIKLHNDH